MVNGVTGQPICLTIQFTYSEQMVKDFKQCCATEGIKPEFKREVKRWECPPIMLTPLFEDGYGDNPPREVFLRRLEKAGMLNKQQKLELMKLQHHAQIEGFRLLEE